MSVIYLISTFILSSPPKYLHISKDHFYVLSPDNALRILGAISLFLTYGISYRTKWQQIQIMWSLKDSHLRCKFGSMSVATKLTRQLQFVHPIELLTYTIDQIVFEDLKLFQFLHILQYNHPKLDPCQSNIVCWISKFLALLIWHISLVFNEFYSSIHTCYT